MLYTLYILDDNVFFSDRCCGQDGYVDGADAATEASLKVGFNQGYREGAAMTAPVGQLKGMLRYVISPGLKIYLYKTKLSVCVCVMKS